jgi:hypothetical protein
LFPCNDIYLHGFAVKEREDGKGRLMTIRRANRRDRNKESKEVKVRKSVRGFAVEFSRVLQRFAT